MYLFQLLRFCWQARLSFMCYPATIQTDYHRELFILRRAIWRLWDNLSNANKQHIIKSQNKCFIRLHSTMINEKKETSSERNRNQTFFFLSFSCFPFPPRVLYNDTSQQHFDIFHRHLPLSGSFMLTQYLHSIFLWVNIYRKIWNGITNIVNVIVHT